MSHYINRYLNEVKNIAEAIDKEMIEKIIKRILVVKKEQGRIFFLGVGGSAANCSHAVNDFRKIAEIDSYTPMDNIAEITSRTNDEGWETVFKAWLERSKINKDDLIFILSVGGGDEKKKVSVNLINAVDYAQKIGCDVVGIVGRDGGHTAKNSYACIIIPTVNKQNVTVHTEAFQSVIWHLIVSHPKLKENETKWESVSKNK